jgi:HPP family protein
MTPRSPSGRKATAPPPGAGPSANPERSTTAPPAHVPSGARRQVARYLGAIRDTERELRNALILVAERHERNYELAHGVTTLAAWSADHLRWLDPPIARYGAQPYEQAALLRSALLSGSRGGTAGELADVCDLAALVQHAEMLWTVLVQGARDLRDDELLDLANRARDHSRRQLAWLTTMVDHEAPDAIAVVPNEGGQLAASLPAHPTSIAAIPDPIWAPMTGGILLAIVGALGVIVGVPWLVPSIGPTVFLIAATPAHPTARLWNTIVGHAGGLAAGFIGIGIVGAASAPSVLGDHELVPARVAAATIAIVLTIALGYLLRASHPPAAASTLLVALGSIATAQQAGVVLAGVVVTAALGELLRLIRQVRVAPAERMAPRGSMVSQRLRGS